MSAHLLADHATLPAPAASPAFVERRRPGRLPHASPELIALMRKPDGAARLRVALYDAPGFLLPAEHRRPATDGRSLWHMAVAFAACSGGCAVALHAMFAVWGWTGVRGGDPTGFAAARPIG